MYARLLGTLEYIVYYDVRDDMACSSSSPALLLFDQHSWIFTLGSCGILHWCSTGDLTEKGRKFDALETLIFEVNTFLFSKKDPNLTLWKLTLTNLTQFHLTQLSFRTHNLVSSRRGRCTRLGNVILV